MEKYLFTVKNEAEVIIEEILMLDSNFEFNINGENYKIEYDKNSLTFNKDSLDSFFVLKYEHNVGTGTIFLKNEKQSLKIPLEYVAYKYTKSGFNLTYKFASQEQSLQITFENVKNNCWQRSAIMQ